LFLIPNATAAAIATATVAAAAAAAAAATAAAAAATVAAAATAATTTTAAFDHTLECCKLPLTQTPSSALTNLPRQSLLLLLLLLARQLLPYRPLPNKFTP
jgi:hypothetical protein